MYRFIAVIAALVSLGCHDIKSVPPPTGTQPAQPNFLVIISDDQRQETMNATYMPRTYALLVEDGVWFERGYVTTAWCCPSRSSIFTGLYARHHGVRVNEDPLSATTVAQRLHEVGYYTGLVGKYLNSSDGSPRPEFDFWAAHGRCCAKYYDARLNVNGEWAARSGYITYRFRDYALDFLRQAPADRPFLLFFTPNAPHAPADPAPGDEALYPDLAPHRPPDLNETDVADKPAWLRATRRLTDAEIAEVDQFRRKQLQALHALDEAVAAVLEELRAQGRLDNTFIVYISDNGYFWGEKRLFGRGHDKNRVYEPAHHVPFVVRYPRLAPQARVEGRLVANIDIAPTLYELAGLPVAEVDGRSLVPLLRDGAAAPWRDDLLLEGWPNPPYTAIHTGRYVYVENERDEPEFYDLEADPHQLDNAVQSPAYAEIVAQLRARLGEVAK